jgi:hypothetical protein
MSLIYFTNSNERWWKKPLVIHKGKILPAELAILDIELQRHEKGVWLNSRGSRSGVIDLVKRKEKYKSIRVMLPKYISEIIEEIYKSTSRRKGCPDLIIWNDQNGTIRFVEVKCPLWDRLREGQDEFINIAKGMGLSTKIVEWEFANAQQQVAADLQDIWGE